MADLAQLESAFMKAHAAGDTKAAAVLAAAIKQGRAAESPARMADEQPQAVAPPVVPPTSEAVYPRGGNDALKAFGEFAQSINVSIPQLLDMPSHVVNWMLEKAGTDVRIPATMERNFNKLPGGEGGFMEPGMARDAVRTGGQLTAAAAGMMPVQRAAGTAGTLLADLLGAGSTATKGAVAPMIQVARDRVENLPAVLPGARAAREAAELPLLRQTGDVEAAGYRLKPAGTEMRVVADRVQQEAIEKGVSEGTIAMAKAANSATKQRMAEMNQVVLRARQNKREGALTRPSVVVGKAINDRLGVIWDANKKAGAKIDEVAETQLRGAPIDVEPAVQRFMANLKKEDIVFDPQTGALDFNNSSIEGLTDLQGIIKRTINRIYNTKAPTAYDAHRAKRFLDEQVTYGKTQAGMSANMSRILKELRHDLDGILDQKFPDYDAANTTYADTVGLLDGIQRLAGERVDLLGPRTTNALGTMSRKILSNYASGNEMLTTLDDITGVAKKYQGMADYVPQTLDDDIVALAVYDGELRSLFPKDAVGRNTFEAESGADTFGMVRDAITGNTPGLIVSGFRKVTGRSPAAMAKAEKELFKKRLTLLNELLKD